MRRSLLSYHLLLRSQNLKSFREKGFSWSFSKEEWSAQLNTPSLPLCDSTGKSLPSAPYRAELCWGRGRQGGEQAAMSVMSSGIKAHTWLCVHGGGAPPHVTGGSDSPVLVKRGLGNWTGLGFRSQSTTCCVIVGKSLAPQSLWPPPIKLG